MRFTDLMVQSIHLRQNLEILYATFPNQLSGDVPATFSFRRIDSSIKRIDSTNDRIREPRATDPRLYRISRFIEEKTGRNGISGCIQENYNKHDYKETVFNKFWNRISQTTHLVVNKNRLHLVFFLIRNKLHLLSFSYEKALHPEKVYLTQNHSCTMFWDLRWPSKLESRPHHCLISTIQLSLLQRRG